LIRGHADVDVRATPARLGRVQALERDVWIASVPIDDVFVRAEALVPEYGGPERTNIDPGILRHGDADDLDLGGVWLDLQPLSLDRDSAGQLNVALAQGPGSSGGCADSHSLRPQIDVGEVADGLGTRLHANATKTSVRLVGRSPGPVRRRHWYVPHVGQAWSLSSRKADTFGSALTPAGS
jgi:hypothetical protein